MGSSEVTRFKQVLVVRTDLKMSKGKIGSQCAHAAMAALLNASTFDGDVVTFTMDDRSRQWLSGRFTKAVLACKSEEALVALFARAKEAGMLCSLIEDSGVTVFNGVPTKTVVAIGPDRADLIDAITGDLPLL